MNTEEKVKITPKYLTKYERARILGVRAFQICLGAPVMVDVADGEIDPLVIALRELKVVPCFFLRVFFGVSQHVPMVFVFRSKKSLLQFVGFFQMERLKFFFIQHIFILGILACKR